MDTANQLMSDNPNCLAEFEQATEFLITECANLFDQQAALGQVCYVAGVNRDFDHKRKCSFETERRSTLYFLTRSKTPIPLVATAHRLHRVNRRHHGNGN
jgi:hypothetical protein